MKYVIGVLGTSLGDALNSHPEKHVFAAGIWKCHHRGICFSNFETSNIHCPHRSLLRHQMFGHLYWYQWLNVQLSDAVDSLYRQVDHGYHYPQQKHFRLNQSCCPRLFISSLHKKMNFSNTDFFSKCDQIRSLLRIWSHFLKKSLMESFIFLCSSWSQLNNELIFLFLHHCHRDLRDQICDPPSKVKANASSAL